MDASPNRAGHPWPGFDRPSMASGGRSARSWPLVAGSSGPFRRYARGIPRSPTCGVSFLADHASALSAARCSRPLPHHSSQARRRSPGAIHGTRGTVASMPWWGFNAATSVSPTASPVTSDLATVNVLGGRRTPTPYTPSTAAARYPLKPREFQPPPTTQPRRTPCQSPLSQWLNAGLQHSTNANPSRRRLLQFPPLQDGKRLTLSQWR